MHVKKCFLKKKYIICHYDILEQVISNIIELCGREAIFD